MDLKSIDKLRELCADVKSMDFASVGCDAVLEIAEEIEQEIAERYMELPLDADGVPIRVGDELFNKNKPTDVYKVTAIADNGYLRIYHDTAHIHSSQCRHVKPRTIEDVLTDFANEVARQGHQIGLTGHEIVMKYAEEIREVLGVSK